MIKEAIIHIYDGEAAPCCPNCPRCRVRNLPHPVPAMEVMRSATMVILWT